MYFIQSDLHIFFFDPVTILLEKLGQLGICSLEEDHQNIETSKETERWLTRADDPGESAMTGKWRLVPYTGVPMGTENTRIADGDHHHLLWVEKNYRRRPDLDFARCFC